MHRRAFRAADPLCSGARPPGPTSSGSRRCASSRQAESDGPETASWTMPRGTGAGRAAHPGADPGCRSGDELPFAPPGRARPRVPSRPWLPASQPQPGHAQRELRRWAYRLLRRPSRRGTAAGPACLTAADLELRAAQAHRRDPSGPRPALQDPGRIHRRRQQLRGCPARLWAGQRARPQRLSASRSDC